MPKACIEHLGDDDDFDGASGGDLSEGQQGRHSGHVAAPALVRALEMDGTSITSLKGGPQG